MRRKFYNTYIVLWVVAFLPLLASCSDVFKPVIEGDETEVGEKVMFTTMLPDISATTRSAKTEWEGKVGAYKPVQLNYQFTVKMLKAGVEEPIATNTYVPVRHTNVGSPVIEDYDGTLKSENETEMYWQDNVNRWGFIAEANKHLLSNDQSTQKRWLNMDYLVGHSYLPIWTGDAETGSGTNPDEIQYKTSKEWYAANKAAMQLSGLMVESNDDYKKIPLYMKHQRAWITIILRAGEGVSREALQYLTSDANIKMTINSFAEGSSSALEIDQPWSREHFIDYPKDKNGEAQTHVSTTRYDAIVMPHNYATRKDEEVIASINLSGQKFSFYAGNDNRFLGSATEEEKDQARQDYNLEAGKHLTIEATLSRESRKILITAWIEDWTEVATATICDDYGQNGDPVVIKSRKELIDFLKDEKQNKQGNVGIIQPTELKLDVETSDDPEKYPLDWPSDYNLNATLNLAGCVLKTKHRLFNEMASSANLVNGTVQIGDGATVGCAIANINNGTIERVNVTTTSELSTAKATVAGMVKENHGTIYQCTSSLTVLGTEGYTYEERKYIGGLAAVSTSPDGSMAVIDGCTVNASVNGTGTVLGGGIVGYVTGRVSNNTFEYGITVSQEPTKFKNIFAQAGDDQVRAFSNGWPTKVLNPINESDNTTNPNNYPPLYDAVFDSQAELDDILKNSSYNSIGKICRISKSFSVKSTDDPETDWTHGTVAASDRAAGPNNVSFILEGNNKTITLTGTKTVKTTTGKNLDDGDVTTYTTAPMLFNYILGEVKDLTIYLDESLVASPTQNKNLEDVDVYNAEDAIAPLAYAVWGENASLTNVNVKAKTGAYVQASTAAGLVVWAFGKATLNNCKVNVPVHMWLPTSMGSDAKHYSGGIVGVAGEATIKQCWYLGNSEDSVSGSDFSLSAKKSPNYYYGGIVGGTSTKDGETPALAIIDCASWFIAKHPDVGSEDQSSKGGIIGYCCYADNGSASQVMNGMAEGNEGNWWPLSAVGAANWLTGLSEEKVIGKRNGLTPTYNDNF